MEIKKTFGKIGVIGGSGFTKLLDSSREIRVDTPYGAPSATPIVGKIGQKEVVFLPRHGTSHQYPPHKVPYRANIYAMKKLGVNKIITCTAVGSIQKKMKPGEFVIIDQLVNLTKNREDTYFDGPITTHVSTAFPYCPQLGKHATKISSDLGILAHPRGTVVVIEGPRFSTAAESIFFTRMGWDIINMTQYPEIALAREMSMCYCAIGLITDYDAGIVLRNAIKPVSTSEVISIMNRNNEKAANLIKKMIESLPIKNSCDCHNSLQNAQI